jgi:hypothetical protein
MRARRRALAAQQKQNQTPSGGQAQGNPSPTSATGAINTSATSAQEAAAARQQADQAARLQRDQQQVLRQYSRYQRQMQDEPRIQDSLGNQPPPYAPVIRPNAQSQDPQGIQEAPGPAQTTPKPVPLPAPQQSQPSSPPQ